MNDERPLNVDQVVKLAKLALRRARGAHFVSPWTKDSDTRCEIELSDGADGFVRITLVDPAGYDFGRPIVTQIKHRGVVVPRRKCGWELDKWTWDGLSRALASTPPHWKEQQKP